MSISLDDDECAECGEASAWRNFALGILVPLAAIVGLVWFIWAHGQRSPEGLP